MIVRSSANIIYVLVERQRTVNRHSETLDTVYDGNAHLQSAYRTNHSTKTAVLKVVSDILLALDSGDLAVLVLLDLSAAFDSVDHAILLQRLRLSFGLGLQCQLSRVYIAYALVPITVASDLSGFKASPLAANQ